MRRWASHIAAFVAGAVAATAIVAAADSSRRERRFAKLDVFAQALSYIENNYVDGIDEGALMYGAVDGMVGSLDRFSRFFPPDEYKRLREDTDGEYGGVGVTVEPDDDGVPVVREVTPRSPAARARLRKGDRIVAIDGTATAGNDWRGTLRGAPGTRVSVEIERDAWDAVRRFRLTREKIRMRAVTGRALDGDIAYVRVRQFQAKTAADVRAAIEERQTVAGVVLDLRGNPGGLFDEAVRTADLFLDSGVIVTVKSRGGGEERESAASKGTLAAFPLAVLIDERSASSAEIVAGALQDHGRAVVVGTPSFGKGSVQTFLDLDDGSGIKLTTSRYYTPGGRSIEGTGIQPDVLVDPSEDVLDTAHQTLHSLGLSK